MKLNPTLEDFSNGKNAIQIHHLLFFVLIICLTPKTGFWFDLQDWTKWSSYSLEHGLGNVYNSGANYMPFYLHALYYFGQIQGNTEAIAAHIYQIKYFFLLFDFAAPLAIVFALRKYHSHVITAYYLLFNIAYLYETVLWGQLDSLPTTVVVLSFILLWQKKFRWAAFLCTLTIFVKLQTIIFLPIYFILFLYHYQCGSINLKLLIQMIVISLLTQFWMLSPFLLQGEFVHFLNVVKESVGFFPKVSWSAFNVWYLILSNDPSTIFDTNHFIKLTYHQWGLLLFCFFYGISMIPLMFQTWQYAQKKIAIDKDYLLKLWLTAGCISLVFFYFNTQMHERYAFPALVMYFAYAILTRHYLLYLLVSIAHLINLDSIFQVFGLNFVKPEVVALLYLAVILISLYELYRSFLLNYGTQLRQVIISKGSK